MDFSVVAALTLLIVGYTIGSVKVINEGDEALVERLGQFHRKLKAGVNFVVPFLDTIVLEDTLREQVLDVEPQPAITHDNIELQIDAVIYWRIINLEQAYYNVEDLDEAMTSLVLTTLRSQISSLNLREVLSDRGKINDLVRDKVAEATQNWGIEVLRVEVKDIDLPDVIKRRLEQDEIERRRQQQLVGQAQAERDAAERRARGTAESLRILAETIQSQANSRELLQFLIAQQYVDGNIELGKSDNSKVVFMDPKVLTETLESLVDSRETGLYTRQGQFFNPPRDAKGNANGGGQSPPPKPSPPAET